MIFRIFPRVFRVSYPGARILEALIQYSQGAMQGIYASMGLGTKLDRKDNMIRYSKWPSANDE